MKHFYVYKVSHPILGFTYVGKRTTHRQPELDNYMGSGRTVKEKIAEHPVGWVKEIISVHKDGNELAHAENEEIRKVYGIPGNLNRTVGFWGCHEVHPETRERQRKAKLGVKYSPEAVAKSAAARRGAKRSAESKALMSAAKTGSKQSDQHKANMSVAMKEWWAKRKAEKCNPQVS